MKPGRELDALIAEKVMGYKRIDFKDLKHLENEDSPHIWVDPDGFKHGCSPPFSTSIEAAWEVVEKLQSNGGFVFEFKSSEKFVQAVFNHLLPTPETLWRGSTVWTEKVTAPHAICLAALKALGVEV